MAEQTPEELTLQAAIKNLYEVFSAYPVPLDLSGCPHCVDPKESEYLVAKPLRSLTSDELWHYNSKALTTWGDIADLKYFLPRLLELPVDLDFTIGKLGYGKWRTWPIEEQSAIEKYLFALWEVALVTPMSSPSLFFIDLASAFDNLQPLLDIWQQKLVAGNRFALEGLADLLNFDVGELARGYLNGCTPAQAKTVITWLISEQVGDWLGQAFFQYSADPHEVEFTSQLSNAFEHRDWIRMRQGAQLTSSDSVY